MSDQQLELLHTFRAFIKAAENGAPIPPVDEHDLKALHELCTERAKRYCGKDSVISIEMTARVCSPRQTCRRSGCATRNCVGFIGKACLQAGNTERFWSKLFSMWLPAFR